MCIRDSIVGAVESSGYGAKPKDDHQNTTAEKSQVSTAQAVYKGMKQRPVSYTHLDVYKRQKQAHSNLWTSTKPPVALLGFTTIPARV